MGDRRGRADTGTTLPQTVVRGGFGKRVVAVGYGSTDGAIRAWESADGGASFNEIATTSAFANYDVDASEIVCDAGGCLLGDALARWVRRASGAAERSRQGRHA